MSKHETSPRHLLQTFFMNICCRFIQFISHNYFCGISECRSCKRNANDSL